jgi:hypothetical protein
LQPSLALADVRGDGVVADQGFKCRDAAAALLLEQRLGHDALERGRQHGADLRLALGRELVDDAVDRRGRRSRVQRAEHEVAGFRGFDCDLDRLEVAHFTDQHDVGVFAQSRAQRPLEALGVAVHFALVDEALFRFVHELDRILDRDDVLGARVVDVVDHRRQRGRLARAGRTGHQHETLGEVAQIEHALGQAELLGAQNLGGNQTEDRAGTAVVAEEVGPEAPFVGQGVGKVGIAGLLELGPVGGRSDLVENRLHLLRRDDGAALDLDHLAMQAKHRDEVGCHVQVGSSARDHALEECVDPGHGRGIDPLQQPTVGLFQRADARSSPRSRASPRARSRNSCAEKRCSCCTSSRVESSRG